MPAVYKGGLNYSNGTNAIPDLADVSLNNLTNGQVLKYNDATLKWENANESGGGSGNSSVYIGTTLPSDSLGSNNDLYYLYDFDITGWTADPDYVISDANVLFTNGGRNYYKVNNGKCIDVQYVSSSWSGGLLVSQEPLACVYRNEAGTVNTTNSYVIDGITWYITTPGNWMTGSRPNTNGVAPNMYVDYSSYPPGNASIMIPYILELADMSYEMCYTITATYCKINGVWVKDETGTKVIGNPEGSPSNDLTKIKIDNILYNIPPYVSYDPVLETGTLIGRLDIGNLRYPLYAPSGGGGGGGGSTVTVSPILSTGEPIALITVDGTDYTIYAPTGGSQGGEQSMIGSYVEVNGIKNLQGGVVNCPGEIDEYTLASGELIPKMTSATAPSGTVTHSSQVNNNYAGFYAFNGNSCATNDSAGWVPAASDTAPYLIYDWGVEKTLNKINIETHNGNQASASRTVYIEGLTAGGTWENCLKTGNSVTCDFTIGNKYTEYFIDLNGNDYTAIRISGDEAWYTTSGTRVTCCISCIQVY